MPPPQFSKLPPPQEVVEWAFSSLDRTVTKTLGPQFRDVLIGAEQSELLKALAADLVDIIPVVGDIANVARVHDAAQRGGDFPRKRIPTQLIDLLAGLPPGIGELLDALTLTNTLNWLQAHGVNAADPPAVLRAFRAEFTKGRGL